MTLYELTNTVTVQGNIEIRIFDTNGNEKESRYFRDQDDFNTRYEDSDDLDDFTITYIYHSRGYDGTPWLVIEITEV